MRIFLLVLWIGLTLAMPAQAQREIKVARIAWLAGGSYDRSAVGNAFIDELRLLGWVEGRNLVVEVREAQGRYERLPELMAELMQSQPDVICTAQTPAVRAAMKATETVPIVMMGAGDPVRYGLVKSLARPEGNVTGLAFLADEVALKALEMAKEAVPGTSRVAFFVNSTNPGYAPFVERLGVAAPRLGITPRMVDAGTSEQLERAFAALAGERVDAIFMLPEAFAMANRQRLVDFANGKRIPAIAAHSIYAEPGALITYSPHVPELLRSAARQVDKLLRGARPIDIPVEQPSRFELIVNLKTARSLDLKLPQALLVRADRIIE